MKRHQSRKKLRSRKRVEALSPCTRYSQWAGINPFSSLLQRSGIAGQNETEEQKQAQKQINHTLKMAADQKSAKARPQRKRRSTASKKRG